MAVSDLLDKKNRKGAILHIPARTESMRLNNFFPMLGRRELYKEQKKWY